MKIPKVDILYHKIISINFISIINIIMESDFGNVKNIKILLQMKDVGNSLKKKEEILFNMTFKLAIQNANFIL